MLLTVADNSTETSSSASTSSLSAASGETYTSTAIWWLQDGWAGACGTAIRCVSTFARRSGVSSGSHSSLPPGSADALQVALPLSLYPDASVKSPLCGTTVKVTAAASGKSIDCVVVGASERNDYTSFTQTAFIALEGDLEAGELAISFTLTDGSSAPAAASSSKVKEAPAAATTKDKAASTTTTKSEAPAAKTAAAEAKDAALNLAQQKATTTTTTAPAATASSSADDSDDDWVCDEEDDDSSTAAATTTQAPAAKSSDAPVAWVDRKSETQKLAAAAPTTTTSEWVAPSSSASSSSAAAWTSSAPAATSSSSSSSAASSDGVADTSGSLSLLSQAGIKGFLGSNTDAIISWYHTNSGQGEFLGARAGDAASAGFSVRHRDPETSSPSCSGR